MDIMLVIAAIVWFVFRSVASKSAKQNAQRRQAERAEQAAGYRPRPEREEQGAGYQPKAAKPAKTPRAWGEWADMLGNMVQEQRPAPPPSPWRSEAAFPPPPAPISSLPAAYVSPEGRDDCHEEMLVGPPTKLSEPDAEPSLPVRADMPPLVQGVIFAEILTRPAQRARPGAGRAR